MDLHVIGVRQNGATAFIHFDYKPDAPVNGGGFFQNVARALTEIYRKPEWTSADNFLYALGFRNPSETPVTRSAEPTDHKVPVFDVDTDRVYLTEDGTPATLICSWSSDEFYAKYA